MKNFILILIASATVSYSYSQDYFQQVVNYKINVALDDVKHVLDGDIKMEYINNSPNTLNEIYIHLWPNAYKDGTTALAKQQYDGGNTLLKYGADSIKGNISNLAFVVNGKPAEWNLTPENQDIAIIRLEQPLLSGSSLNISSPFTVKIPSGAISRLGHVGQSYQITQWYPKPAVYDKNGWNPIPYLNQGEFYSEFGSFDVSITLPANYVVGATGDLQTPSEVTFLTDLSKATKKKIADLSNQDLNNDFPASSSKTKTIRYTQKDVHDFAWFADKRYWVLKDEVELPASKRKVTTWAMFTPKNVGVWQFAPEYINDGTYYYSLWNGDYPYSQVTAVDGTISAGGGMEYPNVTVIGNSNTKEQLEIVIVHEVGHNWFYGILGTNERVHGWMDEGMNTLNEIRYIQTKYPGNTRMSDAVFNGKFHLDHLDYHDQADFTVQAVLALGEDQPIETPSTDFSGLNYGLIMYQKTGLVFHYLKSYLGDELFDKSMHDYYDKWHFKHPQPEDMKASLENSSGKNLDWLFEDLIKTTKHIDYKIKKVKGLDSQTEITVKNVGQVNGPIPVTLTQNDTTLTVWVEPGERKRSVIVDGGLVTKVQIDPTNHLPEINRQNNNWDKKGLFGKIEPLSFEGLIGDHAIDKTKMWVLPAIAYNNGDKAMLGLAFHNLSIPNRPLQFYAVPMYSFGRESVSGLANIRYNYHPKGNLKLFRTGIAARSFKYEETENGNDYHYSAINPYVEMKFADRTKNGPWTHFIGIKGLYKESKTNNNEINNVQRSTGLMMKFAPERVSVDHIWKSEIRHEIVQNQDLVSNVSRTMASTIYKYRYMKKKDTKFAEIRLFGGKIWDYNNSDLTSSDYRFSLSGADGSQDLFFEDLYFNRTATLTQTSNIRQENMGGFKSTSAYGSSKDWMVASNVYLDLPYVPYIGVFGDIGMFNQGTTVTTTWDLGLGIRIRDIVGIYYPILMEESLMQSLNESEWIEKLRVTININLFKKPLSLKGIF